MNKELIKQYKAEFDYWLNGGKLLARRWISDPNDGDCSYTIWYEIGQEGWDIDKVFNYSLEYDKLQVIIDDPYSTYRKALAEGKTVQYQSREILEFGGEREVWKDLNPANISQHHISVLRIKPYEPQFKIGDWVETNKSTCIIKQVINVPENCDTLTIGNEYVGINVVLKADIKLWQPQPNEWCVFWETDVTTYTVARFHSRNKYGAYITVYGHDFYNMAPLEFIQTLKDSHEHTNTNVTGTTIQYNNCY